MYNITIILTRHEEWGLCTSIELYKIIETICPEIIFEEIPPSFFDKYYITKTKRNLESDTIIKYVEKYNIQHIPIDSDNVPPDLFFNDLQFLHKRIEGLTDINGFNYRTNTDTLSANIRMYGFPYLNSINCSNSQKGINDAIEKGVQTISDEKLDRILKQWKKVNENRENEMIKNIYSYSKLNQYNQAVFLIGYAHRNSIMQKINEFKEKETLKIKMMFYNNI